jgi:hypothetical protein
MRAPQRIWGKDGGPHLKEDAGKRRDLQAHRTAGSEKACHGAAILNCCDGWRKLEPAQTLVSVVPVEPIAGADRKTRLGRRCHLSGTVFCPPPQPLTSSINPPTNHTEARCPGKAAGVVPGRTR